MQNFASKFRNKTILVTGGAGSIGGAIAVELLKYKPKAIRVFDTHEYSLYRLEKKTGDYKGDHVRYILGDIRDYDRLEKAAEGVDVIFHAAAYKHVPFCEYNPFEAVKTNVIGTQNVVAAAIKNRVKRVVLISTDKAANPVGTLGASKLLAEKIMTAANYHRGGSYPLFSSVRFGNVTMSNGSVIPHFIDQIRRGDPVTVTSKEITRFLMSMQEAVNLIFSATSAMKGGEVFVFKMKSVKMDDLARTIVQEYSRANPREGKPSIKYTEVRPGEKLHEQLLVKEECEKVIETKSLLVLLPTLKAPYQEALHPLDATAKRVDHRKYSSDQQLMSKAELVSFVRKHIVPSFKIYGT